MSSRTTLTPNPHPSRSIDVRSVGFVVPVWPPEGMANGIITHVANLRQALRNADRDVHLVVTYRLDDSPAPGADGVHRIANMVADPAQPRPSLPARLARSVRRRIPAWHESSEGRAIARGIAQVVERLHRTDHLQLIEMEESFGWASEVVRCCSSVPVVVRLHGPWFLNGAYEGGRTPADLRRIRSEGRAIAAAAGVSAPSRDVLDRVREYYGLALPNARVFTMPMTPPPDDRRWRLASCDRSRVLFVGRFDGHKGGDVLIDAFRRVLERRPEARLTFAGPDPGVAIDPDRGVQKLREFVEERLPGALDDGRIEYLGSVKPAELEIQRRRALATLVPSRYETFGNTQREAMILGCPVVSTGAGGLSESLEDGVNALAVAPGDPDSLAAGILRMLDDPEAAARLGAQAADDCARLYNSDRIVGETLDFYNEVAARHAASRR